MKLLSPPKRYFEDEFPIPKVGDVSSLEGILIFSDFWKVFPELMSYPVGFRELIHSSYIPATQMVTRSI